MNLFYNRCPISSIDDALGLYKQSEFASPTRSTVPLVSLLKHGEDFWNRIAKSLGTVEDSDELHLEYELKPPKGQGTASHTDIMLIQRNRMVAVECKWTEPPYEKVAHWLTQGDSPENRREVMGGWLSLLQSHAHKELQIDQFGSAVYQTVHRAASACATGRKPTLAYIQFCPLPNGAEVCSTLRYDLEYLYTLLGTPDKFPVWLVEVVVKTTDGFEQIRNLAKGVPATSQAVRKALCDGPLFEFEDFKLHRIVGDRSRCP
jgi:hypothetical protein